MIPLTHPEERMDALTMATDPLEDLATALEREASITLELGEALTRQRGSVALDDVSAVLASCDEVARLLLTLEEVRRARTHAMTRAGERAGGAGGASTPQVSLEQLLPLLGESTSARLLAAHRALRVAAGETATQAEINHTVLRRAVEAGEAFLQALFSTGLEPEPVYRASERKEDTGAGWLLDRKA